jgi:predicted DNA repair protein MutK
MPKLLSALSTIGTLAMLWVGGHILLVGTDDLGWHAPYGVVHRWEEAVAHIGGVGGVLAWVINTAVSAVIGLAIGAVVVAVMLLVRRVKGRSRQPS